MTADVLYYILAILGAIYLSNCTPDDFNNFRIPMFLFHCIILAGVFIFFIIISGCIFYLIHKYSGIETYQLYQVWYSLGIFQVFYYLRNIYLFYKS